MNYVVLFPECKNVHLIKDVGMIPYSLHKNFGIKTAIATYQNEHNYSFLSKIPGVRLEY